MKSAKVTNNRFFLLFNDDNDNGSSISGMRAVWKEINSVNYYDGLSHLRRGLRTRCRVRATSRRKKAEES